MDFQHRLVKTPIRILMNFEINSEINFLKCRIEHVEKWTKIKLWKVPLLLEHIFKKAVVVQFFLFQITRWFINYVQWIITSFHLKSNRITFFMNILFEKIAIFNKQFFLHKIIKSLQRMIITRQNKFEKISKLLI